MNKNFADKLLEAIISKKNPSVMGIDPRIALIPEFYINEVKRDHQEDWEVNAIKDYSKEIIKTVSKVSIIFKPQAAYFEKYGWKGFKALEEIVSEIKKVKGIVILDAKRNDIGSTSEAYASAFLDRNNPYGLNVDAITLNGYLGSDAMKPFLDACSLHGKGVFVLVKTSNPSSKEIQDLKVLTEKHEKMVFEVMGERVREWGKNLIGEKGYSSVGAVVGATFPEQAKILRKNMPETIFLVPGYGAQGGTAKDVLPNFDEKGLGAIINSSRKIMYAYKYFGQFKPEEFREAALFSAQKMKEEINEALGNS